MQINLRRYPMPSLSCTVYNCRHNDSKLCNLNTIDVSGGATRENTCCSSFIESSGTSNCSGSGFPETNISCKAHDCTYNENCSCHADNVDVCSCGSACDCHDTECNTYTKG